MHKLKWSGILFLGLFLPVSAFCADESAELWDKIVVTKNRLQFIEPYSLDAKELLELPFDSTVESLNTTPLDLQNRSPHGGIQTDFSLRGSNFQGVLPLLNGQRINDPQTAHHNSDIPITSEDVACVNVLPGAASSVFGPDAIGGAVNFILKKPREDKTILELTGGQFNTFGELFSISKKVSNLGVRLSVENKQSSGFQEDTDYKNFTTSFVSSLDLPQGDFDLSFGYQDKEFGAYDFYTPGNGYLSKEWTKTYLLNTGLNLEKNGLIIKPNFLWRRHFDKFALDKTGLRSNFLSHHRTDTYTPNIYIQKDTGFLGKAGLGLEYGQERINSTTLGKHKRDHKSIFVDDAYDLTDKLSFGLSLRMDDFDGFDNMYTGSASLKYEIIAQNYLHFSFSRSIRAPSFTELYYSDPTTVGNSTLSAEKSTNYEAGYEIEKDKFMFGSTFFLRKEDDAIDWVKTSSTQAQWQADNIPGADFFGLEERLGIKLNEIVNFDANYSYINKVTDKNGYIYKYGPNYIRHLVNTEFIFKLPFGIQSVGFSYKQKPDRRGWFLMNTRLSWDLNKNMQVFFRGTNMLNVEYEEIEGIPQPGRWVEAGFRLAW